MTVRTHLEIAGLLVLAGAMEIFERISRAPKRRDFGGVAGIDADRYRAQLARSKP